jgi:hypothetical protein
MEVHFTPEQEAQLARIATSTGTDAERLVKDAALRLLQEDTRFCAALPVVWLPRCAHYARVSNLTRKDGQRAITSIMAAGKCLRSSMRLSPSRGLCPMKAATTPTLFYQ